MDEVKVYTVNGTPSNSSSSLPDWLTRRDTSTKSKKRKREYYEGNIELIQGFDFPEASNKIKVTQDANHVLATGTYKPQIRCWDVRELSLKFERHTDAENVDFLMLSSDWTKSLHLQTDRSVELHTQGGFHYRTRIPRFGRCLAYHFPSCDALFGAAGNEVYRLNLAEGRFMTPLVLEEDNGVNGVNVVDVNPAHQLWAFGTDGETVHLYDPRSRSRVGLLRLPSARLSSSTPLSVTALCSKNDGLSYAIGTSSGHTLLYDIRSKNPFVLKDQGYSLPIHSLMWLDSQGDNTLVLSADKKVVKLWDKNTPGKNFCSVTPPTDTNSILQIPSSGLLLTANEGIKMNAYYIPALGPAPRWARFLENLTEELEGEGGRRGLYEDYKFVDRRELSRLGLDHLIGTPTLKPYMHGYFLSLKLYDTARLIADPHLMDSSTSKQEKKKAKELERIRAPKNVPKQVAVNKNLAEKILRDEEKAAKRQRRREQRAEAEETETAEPEPEKATLLNDPRFSSLFSDPQYQVDENAREYELLNPSAVAQRRQLRAQVEELSDESSQDSEEVGEDEEEEEEEDGSEEEEEESEDEFVRPPPKRREPRVSFAPMRPNSASSKGSGKGDTFGARRSSHSHSHSHSHSQSRNTNKSGVEMEMSWVPNSQSSSQPRKARKEKVETFGSGLQRGPERKFDMSESDRNGRKERRKGGRSGSRNVFRSIER